VIGRAERLAYVHGRLGARFGARPRATDWARLQPVRDAVSYVDAAKRSPVAALMDGLAPGQPIHAVEAALRGRWRDAVDQVAKWHAPKDRAAIAWMAPLADLPVITHLANEGAVLDWMEADTSLEAYVAAAAGDAEALAPDPETAMFAPAFSGADTAWACWLAHWKTLWPSAPGERAALEDLVSRVTDAGAGREDDGYALPDPDALDRIFEAAYRKQARNLTASIAWLGMTGNDLRRLRGQIATRLALPSQHGQGGAA
jgi:hypothetical protein